MLYRHEHKIDGQPINSGIRSQAFRAAELRSERNRITTLLCVLGSLFALVLIRGVLSLVHGYRGAAWPFALLLAVVIAYEVVWLRSVRQVIISGREISHSSWTTNIFIESLLPTIALFLEIHTSIVGPRWALTSPAVLAYFLLIILSTLHLNPQLSLLAGVFSAIGYAAASGYTSLMFPEAAAGQKVLFYGTSFSYTALLLIGGFAARVVASQIRLRVLEALKEAESRARMERDLGIARSIQQGLLPKTPPRINGFDIAGWNKPADETGGDYFDWQQLADGRLAITVADVTGHGLGPAIGMAGCRAYARAGFAKETDLQSFLAHLNQHLYEDLPAEKFVTLVAGLLDPSEGTVHLISAGHGPLLFYSSAEDRFGRHDAQGPPLGLLPQISYCGPDLLRFARGDMLVLVTDGFIEWANAGNEEFGQNRLEEVIRACRDLSSATIISELYSAVVKFAAMPQPDDLTALVVKRV